MAKATAAEIEAAFPEAVQFARQLREVFGDGVKLVYARNAQGQEIGKRPPVDKSSDLSTHKPMSDLVASL